jgi:hypothetical protein
VPCPSCSRHVRLTSISCPFCDAAFDASLLEERFAPRRNGVQSGIKRAVLFAVGAGMAAACGGETEEPKPNPDPSVQPVYGAPVEPSSNVTSDVTSEPLAQPEYGAPVPSDTNDDVTSEPLAQPEYGAPVPDDTSVQAIYGAPVSPSSSEPLAQPEYGAPIPPQTEDVVDAAAGDAAVDGAAPEEETLDPQPEPTFVLPVYGGPPLQ